MNRSSDAQKRNNEFAPLSGVNILFNPTYEDLRGII